MLYDALGRPVPLAAPPQRIVSLVPSLTEYLFVLGLGARVVAITEFCTRPAPALLHMPRVRGPKNPDRALIAALRPDLVLAAKEENRERDVVALAAAGIPVYVTDICTVADALAQLITLADILDARATATPLLDDLRAALSAAEQLRASRAPRRTLTFIWRDPWLAVGANTYAHDLLRCCGADNVAVALGGRYPRASLETFMELAPELILLPSEPYAFTAADLPTFEPFLARPALRNSCVQLCDGELLTWYGPRSAEALRTFSKILG